MADISKITLVDGSSYDIKDAAARSDIADIKSSISGAMHYIGKTTTALSDGATTNPITIDGESVTATAGDVAVYTSGSGSSAKEMEYVFNGTKWQEFGSTGSLKALAFKDNASATYTPAGSVSSSFTGSSSAVSITATASESGNYTPAGSVSAPTFTGSSMTSTGNFTPAGSVSLGGSENKTATVSAAESGTATYTPAGNVSNVEMNTATVNSITAVGTLPSCTLPTLSTSVASETLTISWTAGTFSAGTLPTKGADTTVATTVKTQPAFTGTGVRLVTGNIPVPTTASFTGTEGSVSVTGTTTGSVSAPTFTGTKVQIEGTTTAAGSVSSSFTGTEATITAS